MNSFIGYGLGLRPTHYQHVLDHRPDVDWFEVISENFFSDGGKPRYYLHAIREHYPIVMHGVSLSIGSSDPLDAGYLDQLKQLASEVQPEWVSDHLCWTSIGGVNSHDLLPLPYTDEALAHLTSRIHQVQEHLGRRILLENVSSYVTYRSDQYTEWDFLNLVAKNTGCGILFDINNVYVSSRNHGFDAQTYLNCINPEYVGQFHLAGHSDYGDYVIDTHDHDVREEVLELYDLALQRFGPISTLLERDDNIPEFESLYKELKTIQARAEQTLAGSNVGVSLSQ